MTAKVQLSPEELDLVNNTEWILMKHSIIKKVYGLFGELNEMYKAEVANGGQLFYHDIKLQNGKISKGENYHQLPYVILDYPAFFNRQNTLAIRTMFWWGHFLTGKILWRYERCFGGAFF